MTPTRALAAAALTVTTLALTGCGDGGEAKPKGSPTTSEASPSESPSETPTETPTVAENPIGKTYTSAGAEVTIKAIENKPSLGSIESGTRKPDAGGTFVLIRTKVKNTGTEGYDLTCSAPIFETLQDVDSRQFDSVDDLYDIPGNPECNEDLQPGFSADMTWAYMVPVGTQLEAWGFYEDADMSDPDTEYTGVPVGITAK